MCIVFILIVGFGYSQTAHRLLCRPPRPLGHLHSYFRYRTVRSLPREESRRQRYASSLRTDNSSIKIILKVNYASNRLANFNPTLFQSSQIFHAEPIYLQHQFAATSQTTPRASDDGYSSPKPRATQKMRSALCLWPVISEPRLTSPSTQPLDNRASTPRLEINPDFAFNSHGSTGGNCHV